MKSNTLTTITLCTLIVIGCASCVRTNTSVCDNGMPLLHVSGEYVVTEAGDTFYIQGVKQG